MNRCSNGSCANRYDGYVAFHDPDLEVPFCGSHREDVLDYFRGVIADGHATVYPDGSEEVEQR